MPEFQAKDLISKAHKPEAPKPEAGFKQLPRNEDGTFLGPSGTVVQYMSFIHINHTNPTPRILKRTATRKGFCLRLGGGYRYHHCWQILLLFLLQVWRLVWLQLLLFAVALALTSAPASAPETPISQWVLKGGDDFRWGFRTVFDY